VGTLFKSEEAYREYDHFYNNSLQLFELEHASLYVPTRFGDTHVLRFGDLSKKPLVLLHGMTMSSTMWYPNMKRLAKDRCVYAVDVMGDFGRSKPVAAIKSKDEAVNWLLDVMDGLKMNETDMAGHSMGGFLAMIFALANQERVSKLVLYAPAGTFHRMSMKFFAKIYPALLFHTDKWIDRAFAWFSGTGEPLHPVFRDQIIAGYSHAKPQLQVMPGFLPKEHFTSFKRPVLLLIGDKEVIYPAQKAIANARSVIPHVEAHVISGANHALTMEHADEVNELTAAFLRHG